MEKILENKLISIYKDGDTYIIEHEGKPVGTLEAHKNTDDFSITFEVLEEDRKKHYASNALYLLTPYLHDTYNVRYIHARVDKYNDQAKHVLEHNGYSITLSDEDSVYYVHQKAETRKDDDYHPAGKKVLYLAGGCFWGMERVFKVLDGVTETKTGYANGNTLNPTYEEICRNETGFRETVRVTYDPSVVSTETVLKAYFLCIDPTRKNGQANDSGSQYQTGVYYRDESLKPVIEKKFKEEKKKYPVFYVELKPLSCFYEAEEYHQDYLTKNPDGYCHITRVEIEEVKKLNHHR